jgi:hypothetical protein
MNTVKDFFGGLFCYNTVMVNLDPSSPPKSPPDSPPVQPSLPIKTPAPSAYKKWLIVGMLLLMCGTAAALFWQTHRHREAQGAGQVSQTASKSKQQTTTPKTAQITTLSQSDLSLDTAKNYGNKYSNGILPVGDNKYVTSGPKQGYIYLCHVPREGGGGAGTRGPWFGNDNTTYDMTKKAKVAGNVSWESAYSIDISNGKRVITTNDLPKDHTTGVFPIQSSDPAYRYDRNPNSIGAQSLTYTLIANPSVGSAGCIGGEVGIMATGVALFDAFDAGGRDAGAWEVQDDCSGHPQNTHEYHYHTLSSCIKDTSIKTVIGYALDGFPITGPTVGANNILTTSDLDECHGITSEINLDGKQVISYHYVMTEDFPYSVSCFKATAIQPPGRQ